ncbi:MAG: 60S ribosomal protein L31 [Candidatus Lokiarchaeota archaeon]|nr:60S ribosomal protein L31 [Candidatus Lokiarchaeota archaeon]
MAKKKAKDISLDDLEEELSETEEKSPLLDENIEEIDEFSIEEVTPEEGVSQVFEEELEEEEEEEIKEEIIDERIYTVPLAKARKGPRTKRANKAVRFLREFMEQHFKPESLVISQEVNEAIWARGIQKPPRKIKIRATKNIEGLVVVYLSK